MRCHWVDEKSELYTKYHDEEWGVPKHDDCELFELLVLESFQAGLSWLTVLKKREAFRKAFDNFDVVKVSQYDEGKIKSLMENASIIRSLAKIKAAVNNARVFLKIQKEWGSFDSYIWHFTYGKIIKNQDDNMPVKTALSDTIAADLQKRGMKFVGSVIIYSYLQAIGVVNDHERACFRY